jgi:hypothetical protein
MLSEIFLHKYPHNIIKENQKNGFGFLSLCRILCDFNTVLCFAFSLNLDIKILSYMPKNEIPLFLNSILSPLGLKEDTIKLRLKISTFYFAKK